MRYAQLESDACRAAGRPPQTIGAKEPCEGLPMFPDCRSAGARSIACMLVVAGFASGAIAADDPASLTPYGTPMRTLPSPTPIARPTTPPPRVITPPPDRIIYPRGQDNVIPNWTDTRVIMNPFDTSTKIVRVEPPRPIDSDGPGRCPTGHYWNGHVYVRYPWYTDWTGTSSYTYYNPVVVESLPATQVEPAPAPVDVSTLPAQDRAIALWSSGNRADAITAMREHLKADPTDADALRTLSIIMLDDKRFDDSFALMRQAYRTDVALADQPIDTRKLNLSTSKLRELVAAASVPANKTKSASAWLTIAVLMQGQKRDDLAHTMLKRAGDQGLEMRILDSFRANLKPSASSARPAAPAPRNPANKPAAAGTSAPASSVLQPQGSPLQK